MENEYNPDVLSCLANLSNDEVFTPPKVVNDMLNLLPPELFKSSKTTFLDIGCKSGVFLREIAKRLIDGLKDEIPDLQKRVDHILHHQLYGIAITELPSLISRRTLYCSKYPNCRYSASRFDNPEGNIRFRNIQHEFVKGRCKWCGASEEQFGNIKRAGLETHAYEFIHTNKPQEIFNMKFDVIVGNPPYQIATNGEDNGKQAKPLYNLFIEQGWKLDPRFILMIIPARWYTGGWGLNKFRDLMISNNKIVELHDFPDATECFSGISIKGGVCYFLWKNDYNGPCNVVMHSKGSTSSFLRKLKEPDIDGMIRFNSAVSILHKVRAKKENTIATIVSSQKPFGLGTAFKGDKEYFDEAITVYQNGGIGYVSKERIPKWSDDILKHKVFISAAYGAGEDYPHQILNRPILGAINSCCTETYITIGSFDSAEEANNLIAYIKTRFFRFMVMLIKNSQHALKKVYSLVPMQDFSKPWTDEELYKKYNLSEEEIKFIESMIKPME